MLQQINSKWKPSTKGVPNYCHFPLNEAAENRGKKAGHQHYQRVKHSKTKLQKQTNTYANRKAEKFVQLSTNKENAGTTNSENFINFMFYMIFNYCR